MLEISSSLVSLCIFPGTLCFVKSIEVLKLVAYPFTLQGEVRFQLLNPFYAKNSYLTKCVIKAGFKECSPFRNEIPVRVSLEFFQNIFTREAFLDFFSLNPVSVHKRWQELSEETKSLFLLSPLFLKSGEIWCIFIEDNILSADKIKKLDTLFSSKVSNSSGIILYSTWSGKSLNFEKESFALL